jgi:hypothetical protein
MWLIYGVFVAYFIAHSMFWALGIFNSAGLLRVFLAVLPLMYLIIGRLLELIWNLKIPVWLRSDMVLLFLVLSFLALPKARDFRYELSLTGTQEAFRDYMTLHPDMKQRIVYTEFIDGAYFMDVDFFNKMIYRTTPRLTQGLTIPDNALVIWQERWSVMEANMPLQELLDHPDLILIDSIQEWGRTTFYVFEKKYKSGISDPNLAYFATYERDTTCISRNIDETKVRLLHKDCQYSGGLLTLMSEIPKNAKSLSVSCKVKTVDLTTTPDVRLIFSYEKSLNEILDYTGLNIKLDAQNAGWQTVKLSNPLKTDFPADVKLKCYVWNPGAAVLLDSLAMRWAD